MSDAKNTRNRKPPTFDQIRAAMRQTKAALAKKAGVPPESIRIENLDQAVEKASAEVCEAIGVPPGTIELLVPPIETSSSSPSSRL